MLVTIRSVVVEENNNSNNNNKSPEAAGQHGNQHARLIMGFKLDPAGGCWPSHTRTGRRVCDGHVNQVIIASLFQEICSLFLVMAT